MFKTMGDLATNFFAPPSVLHLENLKTVLGGKDYFNALRNSFKITFFVLVFNAFLLPMVSYPISRRMNSTRFYKFLFYFIVAGIFVPFQVKMIPIIKLMNQLGFLNTNGIILLYLAYSTSEGVFLIVGYLSSIPTDLEEAATIDGAGTSRIFFRIMYPLLRPIIATVLIRNALWVWNDFFMPLLILNKSSKFQTLPLYLYMFRAGDAAIEYPLLFTVFFLSMFPMIIFYIFLQKQIVGGMMSGAIKG
jgi:raffinose/stachyose/melibiose transport system permease protein